MTGVMRAGALALSLALSAQAAHAQFNPLSIVGRAVSTAMDVRTKAEVAADAEIGAGASKRLLDEKRAEWSGVTVLVFAQHVVLAGAVNQHALVRNRRQRGADGSRRLEARVGDRASQGPRHQAREERESAPSHRAAEVVAR